MLGPAVPRRERRCWPRRGGRHPDWEGVDLHCSRYHAGLHMLGDGHDGRQRALITWQQHVSIDGDPRTMPYQPTGHS